MASLNYLALGDSYTIGECVPLADTYSHQLAQSMKRRESLNVAVDIVAKTGWTTSELLAGIDSAKGIKPLRETYDFGLPSEYRV